MMTTWLVWSPDLDETVADARGDGAIHADIAEQAAVIWAEQEYIHDGEIVDVLVLHDTPRARALSPAEAEHDATWYRVEGEFKPHYHAAKIEEGER